MVFVLIGRLIDGFVGVVGLLNVANLAYVLNLKQFVHHGWNVLLAEEDLVDKLADKEHNDSDSSNKAHPVNHTWGMHNVKHVITA